MTRFPMEFGRVVSSKAGRDEGRYFVVLERIDPEYVRIADGCLRKVDRPKKKKIKHLHAHPACFAQELEKLPQGSGTTNAAIRKCLQQAGYVQPPRKEGSLFGQE